MRMGQGRGCLTESIIRRIDRENRAVWFRRMEKRMRRIIWQAMRETLRFLVLTAGTSQGGTGENEQISTFSDAGR